MTIHTIDLSCMPCCQSCCGFNCENYPEKIQIAITVNSDDNGFCANLFPAAELTFSGDCNAGTWLWHGTIANGVGGDLRCIDGAWAFRSECDPLNWHPVSVLSCSPFHAEATVNFTAFFFACCDGEAYLEFTL